VKRLIVSIIIAILIHAGILAMGNRLFIPIQSISKEEHTVTLSLLSYKKTSLSKPKLPATLQAKPKATNIKRITKKPPPMKKARSIAKDEPPEPKEHGPRPTNTKPTKKSPIPTNPTSTVSKHLTPALPPITKSPQDQMGSSHQATHQIGHAREVKEINHAPQTLNQTASAPRYSNSSSSDGPIFARPRYLINKPPSYPHLARRRGYQGTVILEVLVTKEGRVAKLKVKKPSGYKMLDKAAIKAVKNWLFDPAMKDGKRVEAWVQVPIRFKLQ